MHPPNKPLQCYYQFYTNQQENVPQNCRSASLWKVCQILVVQIDTILTSERLKVIWFIQDVPLATEPGISLIILPLMRILQRNLKRTTGKFVFISHTTNVLLFKFRCNIFIGVRIIKEMPGSVSQAKPSQSVNWGRRLARSASRRPPVC